MRRSLKRIHRHRGCRQTQVQGLTWALRRRLLAATGSRMIDVRNRAILAVAYDAMLRRSELVALQVVDVTIERGGSAGRWKSAAMVQRYGERLLAKRNGAAQLARLQKRR